LTWGKDRVFFGEKGSQEDGKSGSQKAGKILIDTVEIKDDLGDRHDVIVYLYAGKVNQNAF
jgi:hypothetical protein